MSWAQVSLNLHESAQAKEIAQTPLGRIVIWIAASGLLLWHDVPLLGPLSLALIFLWPERRRSILSIAAVGMVFDRFFVRQGLEYSNSSITTILEWPGALGKVLVLTAATVFGLYLVFQLARNLKRLPSPARKQGDPETARRRLLEGGAILVAREFMVAHQIGVGDMFLVRSNEIEREFEIVGVIGSPGLDLAAKYFDIGQEYSDQALHAVFGSRADLIETFGNRAVHFIQIDLSDDINDADALAAIRGQITGTLLSAGSGREIKASIASIGTNMLGVISSIALAAIVIACFGVGNVVVAGIDARRFEFGVLRAVGAGGGMLARLIVAEVVIVIFAAGVVGTLMGLQASWAGATLYRLLIGLVIEIRPPALPIGAGWIIMAILALGAAAPAAIALSRKKPRELLAATKG